MSDQTDDSTLSNIFDKVLIDINLIVVDRKINSIKAIIDLIDKTNNKVAELEGIVDFGVFIHAKKMAGVLQSIKVLFENFLQYCEDLKNGLRKKTSLIEFNNSVEAKNFKKLLEFFESDENSLDKTVGIAKILAKELESLVVKKTGDRLKSYRYISIISKELDASLEMAKKQSDTFFLSLS